MEEFPPLVQVTLSMEERMEKMEVKYKNMEVEFKNMEVEFKKTKKLLLPFCERELLILAGEILKWAVKKQGVEDGNGLHLFDPDVRAAVLLACRAYSGKLAPAQRDVKAFQEMSKVVINLRNSTAHYQNIEALEGMVEMCQDAIEEWPQLAVKYPEQVQIVQKYKSFKQLLTDSFK